MFVNFFSPDTDNLNTPNQEISNTNTDLQTCASSNIQEPAASNSPGVSKTIGVAPVSVKPSGKNGAFTFHFLLIC